jgi:dephospho-CoA kinase
MIIGITGTNGAGKGTVVDYLVKEKGFTHYSVREAITEEILRRGLPVNRTNLNEVATDLRRLHGPAYYAELFMERAQKGGVTDAIIESIRNPKEAEYIQAHGGVMLVVDADKHVRYERIQKRASETDRVSFEEFEKQEQREMVSENPSDPSYMNISAIFEMADSHVRNDGTREELHAQVEEVLRKVGA